MEYNERKVVSGKWLDKKTIENGTQCYLVSEVSPQPSQFKDKQGNPQTQDVGKLKVKGLAEPVNISINRTTIDGFIRAFGKESKNWMNKMLTIDVEKNRVGGQQKITLYLIPQGFERVDDENGYATIVKEGSAVEKKEDGGEPTVQMDDLEDLGEGEIKPEDLPF